MGHLFRVARSVVLGAWVFCSFVACEPVPETRFNLTSSQKQADMLWLYSQFDTNYAPLEYKAKKYGFDYEVLKQDYLTKALATKSNEEFYRTMKSFVAQFKDAHTQAALTVGSLKGRGSVAFIGISGKRKGNRFVVTELLPTFDPDTTNFPIHVGDEITHIDGKPLMEAIREELLPLEDVGQDQANLTIQMNRLFSRVSTSQNFPTIPDAVITIAKRSYTEDEAKGTTHTAKDKKSVQEDVTVPWNIRDIYDFRKEQAAATAANLAEQKPDSKSLASLSPMDVFKVPGDAGKAAGFLGFRDFNGNLVLPSEFLANLLPQAVGYNFLKTFYFVDQVESWTSNIKTDAKGNPILAAATPTEKFKAARSIPADARFITADDAVFPTYLTEESVFNSAGKTTGEKKLIATMFLSTFSPGKSEDVVIKEFKKTLENLAFYRVQDLVIDMINNGGGSLSLGMQLAQALSSTKVVMPKMQFALSDTWMRQFQTMSVDGASDADKTLASRVVTQFDADLAKGSRLSSPLSAETLIPYALTPNTRLRKPLNTVLMVNEMCASMCDIFSAILQDNNMAKVLGAQTMGAGGNVVAHFQAPNSHLTVRQTESLIVRTGKEGVESGYLENNGVMPDLPFDVLTSADSKYSSVHDAAVLYLTTPANIQALLFGLPQTGDQDQDLALLLASFIPAGGDDSSSVSDLSSDDTDTDTDSVSDASETEEQSAKLQKTKQKLVEKLRKRASKD